MKKVKTPAEIRNIILRVRREGKSIGLVPTMGALHEGHISLVRQARESCDYLVASIFVNPVQFGPGEDLESYPRNLEKDCSLLAKEGCDLLFVPEPEDMYSGSESVSLSAGSLGEHLCGSSRPGHFSGVLLVVSKLFNMIQPDSAFFGQKDAQQAVIIQRMAADLDFPVRIAIGQTVREGDGLALSSRNGYLDEEERNRAPALYAALCAARDEVAGGETESAVVARLIRDLLEEAGFRVDYAEAVDAETLQPVDVLAGTVLIAAAGYLGKTRLIDNIAIRIKDGRVEETTLEFPEWSRYEK